MKRNSATLAIVVATLYFPHGELVEPRTAALPSGKSAPSDKISVAVYPRPAKLAYSIPVLPVGTASGAVRSGERIGASDGG
jgi:hypothetical protein